jgi:hypothetical protein
MASARDFARKKQALLRVPPCYTVHIPSSDISVSQLLGFSLPRFTKCNPPLDHSSEMYGIEVEDTGEGEGDGEEENSGPNHYGRGKRRRVQSRRYGAEFWKHDLLNDSDDDK